MSEQPPSEPQERATNVLAEPEAMQVDVGYGAWEEDDVGQLPPRPRSRLLRPLPIALVAVLIACLGFLGGVLVQKSHGESSAGALPGGGSFPALPGVTSGQGDSNSSAGGSTAGGAGFTPPGLVQSGGGTAVIGTVANLDGKTIYVTDSQGNTLKVRAADGSTVTRNATVGVRAIHPGDSIVISGNRHNGTVKASSISATAEGASATTGPNSPAASVSGAAANQSSGSGSVNSLFGN